VSGKNAGIVAVVDVFDDVQARRRDPDEDRRRRQAAVLTEAGWPPAELVSQLGTDTAYRLLDPERARVRARRARDDAYDLAMSSWMQNHRSQKSWPQVRPQPPPISVGPKRHNAP
jgi:hypothetical protein